MNLYAQLDENGVVVGLSQLSGPVDLPNMVEITEYDEALMGQKFVEGKFVPLTYYVSLDEQNIVVDILSHQSDKPRPKTKAFRETVKVESADYGLIGKVYDGNVFSDPAKPSLPSLPSLEAEALNDLSDKVERLTDLVQRVVGV